MTALYAIADAELLRRRGIGLREFAEGLRAAGVGRAGREEVLLGETRSGEAGPEGAGREEKGTALLECMVQWRCKGGSAGEVLAGAAVLREVFAGSGCRLILNDFPELVEASGFDGVHVGQGDLRVEEARRMVGPRRVVGVSTHTEAEVRGAELSTADYVAVGPLFRTGTKLDAEPVVGLAGVGWARRLTSKRLVAIGGITAGNAREVMDAGPDAVAVIGALCEPGRRVEESARELLRALAERR